MKKQHRTAASTTGCVNGNALLGFTLLLNCCAMLEASDHRSGFHWARDSESFTLGVISNVQNTGTNDWDDNFDWALNQWSNSSALDLVRVKGDTSERVRQACKPVDGYISVCNGNYGATLWNGRAEWTYKYKFGEEDHGGHLFNCVVFLNDFTSLYSDEKKLLCHEIGHCLGLGHTSEDGSTDGTCMDYSSDLEKSRGPSEEDFAVLEDVYKHTDDWNSYEFVDPLSITGPTKTPVSKPTPAPTRFPTRRPTARPTPRPTNAPTKRLTSPPTKSPTNPPNLRPSKMPIPSPTPISTAPPTTGSSCSKHSDKKDCKKDFMCDWDKETDICKIQELGSDIFDNLASELECAAAEDKDICKQSKTCKWKKDECIFKGRRLEEDDCPYDPEEFGVDSDANVFECDNTSVTFEKINGEFVTRYHVLFSDYMRRQRNLL